MPASAMSPSLLLLFGGSGSCGHTFLLRRARSCSLCISRSSLSIGRPVVCVPMGGEGLLVVTSPLGCRREEITIGISCEMTGKVAITYASRLPLASGLFWVWTRWVTRWYVELDEEIPLELEHRLTIH